MASETRELRMSKKPRYQEAPECPCGEPNSKSNPQFAPFADCDGKYGYCHRCDKTFFPNEEPNNPIKYIPPPRVQQQYITVEPAFNFLFQDTVMEPAVSDLKNLNGLFNITFYFRNIHGKLTSAKKMAYNFTNGGMKRVKDKHPLYLYQRDSGYYACLFNERDLFLYPDARVLLVESEKTAGILRLKFKAHLSEWIYLAVGGSNGLSDEKISVLKGREVYVCYDCDQAEPDGTKPKGREAAKSAVTKLSAICTVRNYDIDPNLTDGTDLADLPNLTYDYIQAIPGASQSNIEPRLVQELREMNQEGQPLTDELLKKLETDFLISPEHIRNIFFIIKKEFADEFNIKKAPQLKKIEFFFNQRYLFRRNSVNKRVYYRTRSEKLFRECNASDLWRELQHNIFFFGNSKTKISISDIEHLLDSDYVSDYNPFEEYFDTLPQWDGVDHILKLSRYVTCDDQQFWELQFKKALVRMIACTINHIPNRIVMVLIQEAQEKGKSQFLRFLCPPSLIRYYKEDKMKKDNKDMEIALAENFIWNLEELDQLNKKEVSDIKDIISRQYVKQRRSYGRYEEEAPRIVNFWGSTNKVEFLTDTQNSRWLCFKVIDINHNYNNFVTKVKEVDINKVWAQAWYLYKSGFEYNLTTEEREQRDMVNKTFENVTNEKELVIKHIRPSDENEEKAEFLVNVDILKYLIEKTGTHVRLAGENVSRAMKQLNFQQKTRKINGKTCRGYWIIKRDDIETRPVEDDKQPSLFGQDWNTDELPF